MFHYLKSPILHVHFSQNLPIMNILDPMFYRTLFLDFSPVPLPPPPEGEDAQTVALSAKNIIFQLIKFYFIFH